MTQPSDTPTAVASPDERPDCLCSHRSGEHAIAGRCFGAIPWNGKSNQCACAQYRPFAPVPRVGEGGTPKTLGDSRLHASDQTDGSAKASHGERTGPETPGSPLCPSCGSIFFAPIDEGNPAGAWRCLACQATRLRLLDGGWRHV